jgi:hypothetical protein
MRIEMRNESMNEQMKTRTEDGRNGDAVAAARGMDGHDTEGADMGKCGMISPDNLQGKRD